MRTVLESLDRGGWAVRRYDAAGRLVSDVPRAVAVRDLCRIMRKSRRQVYRYMGEGRLATAGKYLGEWLVDARGLDWFAGTKTSRLLKLPRSARLLFPEYSLSGLNPINDASVVVPRIMEQGDRRETSWMLRQYPAGYLRKWTAAEGWRLGPRAARFWSWYLGIPRPGPRHIPSG